MKKNNHPPGMSGKIGGQMVKNMIQDVEQKIAGGMHVSAAPSSQAEADNLQKVKMENKKSGERSK